MVERATTTFLFIFLLLMFGVLVASVVYNYQMLQYVDVAVLWFRSLFTELEPIQIAEVATPTSAFLDEHEGRVLGAKLTLLTDAVPYPVLHVPRNPQSVFAPLSSGSHNPPQPVQ